MTRLKISIKIITIYTRITDIIYSKNLTLLVSNLYTLFSFNHVAV